MYHAVSKGRGGNEARLGVIDAKVGVRAGRVGVRFELGFQVEQVPLQVKLKCGHVGRVALSARGVLERQPQILEIGDERVQMFVCFHGRIIFLEMP